MALNSFNYAIIWVSAAVAQLDRVLGYEPRGRGFNSCQPHHNKSVIEQQLRDQKSLGCFSLCAVFSSPSEVKFFTASPLNFAGPANLTDSTVPYS